MKARNDGRATGAAGLFVSGTLGLDGTAPQRSRPGACFRIPCAAGPVTLAAEDALPGPTP
jgi:hypothetical protein